MAFAQNLRVMHAAHRTCCKCDMCITSELLWRVLVQLEAAKVDREKVQGDISFRNTRIEEVYFCAI
jgi:hypothetical protein